MAQRHPDDAVMTVREIERAADLRGDATRTLFEYWDSKRGAHPYPDWPDIQLMDLWRIAAALAVKDVIDGGADFFNRYWGSQLTDAVGFDGTGRTSKDIYGADSETNLVNYRRVVADRRPIATYRRLTFVERREHVGREAVHLPLGPDGGPVTHIVSAYDYECEVSDLVGD